MVRGRKARKYGGSMAMTQNRAETERLPDEAVQATTVHGNRGSLCLGRVLEEWQLEGKVVLRQGFDGRDTVSKAVPAGQGRGWPVYGFGNSFSGHPP